MEMQPSFYAIIPAHVRYCKELEAGAKLLYGELTALATQYGFCWATNHYFADLYGVCESTVKKWISSLKSQKFIKVEIEVEGIQRRRKIWISNEFQKMFTKGKNLPDVGQNFTPRGVKNYPCINTTNTTNESKEREGAPPPPPAPPVPLFAFKRVSMREEEYKRLVEEYGEAKVTEKVEALDEYADINPKKFKQYGKHSSVIRSWIKKDLIKNKFDSKKGDSDLNASQKENLKLNDELVNELKLDYPDRCSTMSIYYKNHLLKSKDPYFDISMLVDHKEFCRFLEKHLKIRILEVRFPNG